MYLKTTYVMGEWFSESACVDDKLDAWGMHTYMHVSMYVCVCVCVDVCIVYLNKKRKLLNLEK